MACEGRPGSSNVGHSFSALERPGEDKKPRLWDGALFQDATLTDSWRVQDQAAGSGAANCGRMGTETGVGGGDAHTASVEGTKDVAQVAARSSTAGGQGLLAHAQSPEVGKASSRKRVKTEKARQAEEEHCGLGASRGGDAQGENSRRRPRTAELPLDYSGPDQDAAAFRAPKQQKKPGCLGRGGSVDDALSIEDGGADGVDGSSRDIKEEEARKTEETEAEEAWGAATALMELFSRVDDKAATSNVKPPTAVGRRPGHSSQEEMPPPPPINTPRSNPQTPRGGRGQNTPRGNSPRRGGGATLADRVAAAVSSGMGEGGGAVSKSPRGGGGDRSGSVDSSPCMSPRGAITGAAAEGDGKHNKYCHFCQHIKVKKAKSMRACTNPECARRFCEHCLSVHMSEILETYDVDSDWLCPICRKVCCCASQSCSKSHRHCKAYRYRLRRARSLRVRARKKEKERERARERASERARER